MSLLHSPSLSVLCVVAACGSGSPAQGDLDALHPVDAGSPVGSGTISFLDDPTGAPVNDIGGAFYARAPHCVQEAVSGCTYTTCDPAPSPVSAGTLTMHWPSANGDQHLDPGPDGTYSFELTGLELWQAGDELTVSAAGSTVPAFDAQLAFPSHFDVITDELPEALVRGSDLTIGAGEPGTRLDPSVVNFFQGSSSLACAFPAPTTPATLGYVVPGAALAALSSSSQVTMTWFSTTAATVVAGDYAISVVAMHAGMSPLALDVD